MRRHERRRNLRLNGLQDSRNAILFFYAHFAGIQPQTTFLCMYTTISTTLYKHAYNANLGLYQNADFGASFVYIVFFSLLYFHLLYFMYFCCRKSTSPLVSATETPHDGHFCIQINRFMNKRKIQHKFMKRYLQLPFSKL